MNKEYKEYYKDPRWQKMRLKVLERDIFSCQKCFDAENTLHVHHRYYLKGNKPWEYDLEALVTLCDSCHEDEHKNIDDAVRIIGMVAKSKFLSLDIKRLACAFGLSKIKAPVPEVEIEIIRFWLMDEKRAQFLKDKFFDFIETKGKTNG